VLLVLLVAWLLVLHFALQPYPQQQQELVQCVERVVCWQVKRALVVVLLPCCWGLLAAAAAAAAPLFPPHHQSQQ
jgi:hypothetical protein